MERRARGGDRAVLTAIRSQADACRQLGSPLYGRMLDGAAADHARGGVVRRLLDGVSDRPVHDAVVLRLLAATHRLALAGEAPAYARHLPSCGGTDATDPVPAFLDLLAERRDDLARWLRRPVQTNEVGRAAALVGGFHEAARRSGRPLRCLEIGASAGLLLQWDHYRYDTGAQCVGPADSPLRLEGHWRRPPTLLADVDVAERRGCDLAPVAATDPAGRLTLASFVWPDQLHRMERLRAALEVASRQPPAVETADAAEWIERELTGPAPSATTVVHHSIVLQYLGRTAVARVRAAIVGAGDRATEDAPLAWLRMEPAGPRAEIRLTWWPGGHDELLGTAGYHGDDVDWT